MITWALFRKGLRNMGCHWLISSRSLETPVRVSDQHVWPPYISIRIFLTMRFFICTPLFLSDTKLFHNETVVALAMDGAPDIVLDGSSRDKKYYCGAVSIRGNIEVFQLLLPVCTGRRQPAFSTCGRGRLWRWPPPLSL